MLLVVDNPIYLGYDVAAAFDLHPIAEFDAEALDKVHVVQGWRG